MNHNFSREKKEGLADGVATIDKDVIHESGGGGRGERTMQKYFVFSKNKLKPRGSTENKPGNKLRSSTLNE